MIIPKLQEIRKRVGLSQSQLALQMGVDTSLVSRWEKGEREPSIEQGMHLARLFGVTFDYLVHGDLKANFKFRAVATLTTEEKQNIQQVLLDAEQQICFLDAAFQMAGKKPKPFLLNLSLNGQQIVEAAKQIRSLLMLNDSVTFEELRQALTERNIFIFAWNMPQQISGLSYRGNFTVIFINQEQTEERRLFTLSHECIHVLCHLHSSGDKEGQSVVSIASNRNPQEREANQVTAELLMPTDKIAAFIEDLGSRLKSKVMLDAVARHFNVSRDALFYRLASMGFFEWNERGKYFDGFTPKKWKPVPRVTQLNQQVAAPFLKLALSLYDQGEISESKLAEWFGTSRLDVEEFLSESERREDYSTVLEN
ncbi:MAG: XRE family transcriptional regulator [Blastocatellia bacterium]|nr:XRE family transcriptional regulator [Blastocatellia bacterium]